jgi:hypothetical protein
MNRKMAGSARWGYPILSNPWRFVGFAGDCTGLSFLQSRQIYVSF